MTGPVIFGKTVCSKNYDGLILVLSLNEMTEKDEKEKGVGTFCGTVPQSTLQSTL
jgi:hypothetical protein